jgi:hypothetical protein
VAAEGDVQLLLDLRILGPVALHESKKRPVAGSVAKDGTHLMALRQVVSRRPETLIERHVVGVEHGVHVSALEIRPPLEKKINEVPTPRSQGHVERNVPLELKLVAVAQQ